MDQHDGEKEEARTSSKGAVVDEAYGAAAERGLVAFRCRSCTPQPFERMDFVTPHHVDMTNWKLNAPKDTHERFNSPFPNLGPDVLDGHPKSGAVCRREPEVYAAAGSSGSYPKSLDTASPLVSAPRGEAAEDLPEILANCGHGFVRL